MGYAQWIQVIIKNRMYTGDIKVQNAKLAWGKFYKDGDKDQEISPADVDTQVATTSNDGNVYSCGRADAASGTEGSFDLYDGGVKIRSIYWDCPWGSKANTFTVGSYNSKYIVEATGANTDAGAIGNVTVVVAKI